MHQYYLFYFEEIISILFDLNHESKEWWWSWGGSKLHAPNIYVIQLFFMQAIINVYQLLLIDSINPSSISCLFAYVILFSIISTSNMMDTNSFSARKRQQTLALISVGNLIKLAYNESLVVLGLDTFLNMHTKNKND